MLYLCTPLSFPRSCLGSGIARRLLRSCAMAGLQLSSCRTFHEPVSTRRNSVSPRWLCLPKHNRLGRAVLRIPRALDGKAGQTFLSPVETFLDTQSNSTEQTSSAKHTVPEACDAAHEVSRSLEGPADGAHWQLWSEHIEYMERLSELKIGLERQLKEAVAREKYADAAEVKVQLSELYKKDEVRGVVEGLRSALQTEDYSQAALLRDDGFAALQGWWCGQADGDPNGHLLRITPEFGRWTGKIYTPRELAEMKGWADDMPGRAEKTGVPVEDMGTPMFEIFLRRGETGGLDHQVVSFRPPNEGDSLFGSMVTLDLSSSSTHDASLGASEPSYGDWEKDEVLQTLQELRGDASTAQELSSSSADDNSISAPLSDDPRASTSHHPPPDVSQQILNFASPSLPPIITTPDAREEAGLRQATRSIVCSHDEDDSLEDDEEGLDVQRVPAEVSLLGVDKFVFQANPVWPAVEVRSSAPRLPLSGAHADDELPPEASPEWRSSSSSSASSSASLEPWRRIAEEVLRKQSMRHGRSLPHQKLSRAIALVARHLRDAGVAPEEAASLNAAVERSAAADGAAASALPGSLQGPARVMYSRINTKQPKTDPFSGLYLGAFGPHGPELLQLSRGMYDGEECVMGVKLTGDANVPAGAVSFRARIGRSRRLDARDAYPADLAVTARYRGEGRVAQPGFRNPRWVDGELLQFAARGGPLTGGADLGFVWAVPNERRFLILLNRIDLD